MNTHSKFFGFFTIGAGLFPLVAVTLAYVWSAVPLALEHPVSGMLFALSYMALLGVLLPGMRGMPKSIRAMQSAERSLREFMQEHGEEVKVLEAESRYEKPTPMVMTKEELQYLWTPRAYFRHPRGKDACRAAGMLFLAFAFLCVERALFRDQRGVMIWSAIALVAPVLIQLLGVTSYCEVAVMEHFNRRIHYERPWLFENPENEA